MDWIYKIYESNRMYIQSITLFLRGLIIFLFECVPPVCRVLLAIPFIGEADAASTFRRWLQCDAKLNAHFNGKVCWITGIAIAIVIALLL